MIDEDLTLLAPTDHAFARIPHEVKDRLLGNSTDRRRFLAEHLVPQRLSANEIARRRFIPRLRGAHLPVATRDGAMRVGPAILTRGDLRTPGGIVHVIDDVLLTA